MPCRTKEALAVRKEQGVVLGRKHGACPKIRMLQEHENEILKDFATGISITHLSNKYGVSRDTMSRFIKSPR